MGRRVVSPSVNDPGASTPADPSDMPTLLGIEFGDIGAEVAEASLPVTGKVLQPYGIVHGGALSALAETVTSYATGLAVRDDGMIAMGQSNNASFLRPITAGTIHATARSRHRGRTTWVWDVELSDDEGRLCALVRMTVAVRPAPEGQAR
jgi:1,4-dihydroxy-2-naphthoyl-CoA hydrolase